MSFEFILSKHFAVGQKSEADPGPYGRGFNYRVYATFTADQPRDALERHLSAVVQAIDHRFLGLDTHVIEEPSTANIGTWILAELKARGAPVVNVHLVRGDGLEARVGI